MYITTSVLIGLDTWARIWKPWRTWNYIHANLHEKKRTNGLLNITHAYITWRPKMDTAFQRERGILHDGVVKTWYVLLHHHDSSTPWYKMPLCHWFGSVLSTRIVTLSFSLPSRVLSIFLHVCVYLWQQRMKDKRLNMTRKLDIIFISVVRSRHIHRLWFWWLTFAKNHLGWIPST